MCVEDEIISVGDENMCVEVEIISVEVEIIRV